MMPAMTSRAYTGLGLLVAAVLAMAAVAALPFIWNAGQQDALAEKQLERRFMEAKLQSAAKGPRNRLTAKLTADGAACAGDHDGLAAQVAVEEIFDGRHGIATQQVFDGNAAQIINAGIAGHDVGDTGNGLDMHLHVAKAGEDAAARFGIGAGNGEKNAADGKAFGQVGKLFVRIDAQSGNADLLQLGGVVNEGNGVEAGVLLQCTQQLTASAAGTVDEDAFLAGILAAVEIGAQAKTCSGDQGEGDGHEDGGDGLRHDVAISDAAAIKQEGRADHAKADGKERTGRDVADHRFVKAQQVENADAADDDSGNDDPHAHVTDKCKGFKAQGHGQDKADEQADGIRKDLRGAFLNA